MSMKKIISLKNISKRFGGVKAVEDISLDLFESEVCGIVGHNGAGKTVLMNILSGVYHPDTGEIYYYGNKVNFKSPADAKKKGIETIHQNLALAENLNASANLFLGREIYNKIYFRDEKKMFLESKKAINKINKYFKDFNTNVANLSGGQKQSIAIARAVYFNAKVIIMDEPTAALGPEETAIVREIIKKLKKNGISIFLISHDINDLFDLSDKIAVLKNGKLVDVKEKLNSNKDEILEMIIKGK